MQFHQMKEATNMYLRRNDRKVLRACNQLTKSKHPWDTATETGRELYQIAKSAFIFQTPKVWPIEAVFEISFIYAMLNPKSFNFETPQPKYVITIKLRYLNLIELYLKAE